MVFLAVSIVLTQGTSMKMVVDKENTQNRIALNSKIIDSNQGTHLSDMVAIYENSYDLLFGFGLANDTHRRMTIGGYLTTDGIDNLLFLKNGSVRMLDPDNKVAAIPNIVLDSSDYERLNRWDTNSQRFLSNMVSLLEPEQALFFHKTRFEPIEATSLVDPDGEPVSEIANIPYFEFSVVEYINGEVGRTLSSSQNQIKIYNNVAIIKGLKDEIYKGINERQKRRIKGYSNTGTITHLNILSNPYEVYTVIADEIQGVQNFSSDVSIYNNKNSGVMNGTGLMIPITYVNDDTQKKLEKLKIVERCTLLDTQYYNQYALDQLYGNNSRMKVATKLTSNGTIPNYDNAGFLSCSFTDSFIKKNMFCSLGEQKCAIKFEYTAGTIVKATPITLEKYLEETFKFNITDYRNPFFPSEGVFNFGISSVYGAVHQIEDKGVTIWIKVSLPNYLEETGNNSRSQNHLHRIDAIEQFTITVK